MRASLAVLIIVQIVSGFHLCARIIYTNSAWNVYVCLSHYAERVVVRTLRFALSHAHSLYIYLCRAKCVSAFL